MVFTMDKKLSAKILRTLERKMSYILRKILKFSMLFFYAAVKPYTLYFSQKITSQKLPPIKNDLLKIPGVILAEMIRDQRVSCEKVIQAYIDRCREVDPLLNAIVEDRFDEALHEAREIDRQIKSGERTIDEMKTKTPLLGLPITVKESIMVKGMSNTSGRVYKNRKVAIEDAPIIKNVKKHGGIILCLTNTPELCLCWETYNNVKGTTKNPYDLKRTPGGSSGGEAALLGAGASLLGLGSDVAGSIRLPALFVGVYSHKPTPLVCSPYGHNPQSEDPRWGEFFTTAPIVRYAEDLSLLLDAAREEQGPQIDIYKDVNLQNINFFYIKNDGSGLPTALSSCVKKNFLKVAGQFNAKEIEVKNMKWALDISVSSMLIMDFDTIYTSPEEGQKCKTPGKEFCKYLVGQSDSTMNSVIIALMQSFSRSLPKSRKRFLEKIKQELKDELNKMLGDNGVLFFPTFPTSANKHFEIYYRLFDPIYLMIWNTLGMPVSQIHTGYDKNNMPIGLQVVASPNNDHLTIAVAQAAQKIFGGWHPPEDLENLGDN